MRKVVGVSHVFQSRFTSEDNPEKAFNNNVIKAIEYQQDQGQEVEVQYSTCPMGSSMMYSTLILGYIEEE